MSKHREAERNRLTREKAVLDQLVRGVTRMVNSFAVCDLEGGTYQYYSFAHDELFQPNGQYADLLARMDELLMPLDEETPGTMSDYLKGTALRRRIKTENSVYRFDYCSQDKTDFRVMSAVPLVWHDGVLTKVMLVSEDSSQKHALEVLANTDSLTGLYNARNFALTLKKLEGKPFVLFYLDLNGFKAVNDRHGHAAGDRLLQIVAKRLLGCMRTKDRVFRVGGDEFCLLVMGILTAEDREKIVARVKAAVALPYMIGALELEVTASCGYAASPADSRFPDEVRGLADRRMYEDKAAAHQALRRAALAGEDTP